MFYCYSIVSFVARFSNKKTLRNTLMNDQGKQLEDHKNRLDCLKLPANLRKSTNFVREIIKFDA
jgi:hypothetical protein